VSGPKHGKKEEGSRRVQGTLRIKVSREGKLKDKHQYLSTEWHQGSVFAYSRWLASHWGINSAKEMEVLQNFNIIEVILQGAQSGLIPVNCEK